MNMIKKDGAVETQRIYFYFCTCPQYFLPYFLVEYLLVASRNLLSFFLFSKQCGTHSPQGAALFRRVIPLKYHLKKSYCWRSFAWFCPCVTMFRWFCPSTFSLRDTTGTTLASLLPGTRCVATRDSGSK